MSTPKNVMKNAKGQDSDSDDEGYVVDFPSKRFNPLSFHDLLELNPSYRKLTFSELKNILEKQKQDLDRDLEGEFDREIEKDKVIYREEVSEAFNKPLELIENYIPKDPVPEDPIPMLEPIPLSGNGLKYTQSISSCDERATMSQLERRRIDAPRVVRVVEVDEDAELARALALSLETYEQQNGLKESKAGKDSKESTDRPSSDPEAFNAMDFYTEMSVGTGSTKEIDWEIEQAKERVRKQTPRSFNGPD